VHLWDSCRNKRDQICPKITKKRALLKTHLCDSNQSLIFLVLPRKFYGEGSLWPGRSCRSYDIYCKYLNPHIFFVFCVRRLIGMMSFLLFKESPSGKVLVRLVFLTAENPSRPGSRYWTNGFDSIRLPANILQSSYIVYRIKHRKNRKCCPGHSLSVSQSSKMSQKVSQ